MKIIMLFFIAAFPTIAGATWDTAGNGLLNGTYNFRQVLYISDGSGNINQEIAYFGNISFDGNGNYTLPGGNTQLNTGTFISIQPTGTYSIGVGGYGILSSPLIAGASVYILVANHILIGSSTETPGSNGAFNNDLFIAAPATPSFTNASFNGTYTIASFEPGLDLTYSLNPDGAGDLGTVTQIGYLANNAPGSHFTESAAGASYAFVNGVATENLGLSVVANGATLIAPQESLFVSPDTNFVFGGSPTSYDIFVGVRGAGTLTPGLYYEIGIDEDASQYIADQTANIDTYYGVFNAFSGSTIGHERLLYAGSSAEGVTYATTYPNDPVTATGAYTAPADVGQLDPSATVQYTVGASGIRIGFGIGPWLGIELALPAAAPTPSGAAFIDPTGIVNTASSAPFTAGISPGEFITLYNGAGLTNSAPCATGAPFPKSIGGIQLLIDNIPAPLYCVSPQITAIVPYEVTASPIATLQVVNNNVPSNIVTAWVYPTTPGVFSYSPVGGTGFAAAEHGNYSLITTANPAQPGEEIAVYLTGLGNVFPVNGVAPVDGAATGPNGDNIIANVEVDVAGFGSTSIPYAGLSPDPGLYQINFVVPTTAPAGNDALAIVGPGSYSSESLLPVGPGALFANGPSPATHRRLPARLSKGTIQP